MPAKLDLYVIRIVAFISTSAGLMYLLEMYRSESEQTMKLGVLWLLVAIVFHIALGAHKIIEALQDETDSARRVRDDQGE